MKEDLGNRQLLLIVGTEGGGVKLYGEHTDTGWRFSCAFVDQTPYFLSEGEDQREIRRTTKTVRSWNDAVAMLDQQRWTTLSPVMVHPEFRERVWEAVRVRPDPNDVPTLEKWRDRCRIP